MWLPVHRILNFRPVIGGAGGPAAWGRLATFFVLLTLGLQIWPGAPELLRFSRADYERGAVWQLLSAQLVHLSNWHAAANASAFAMIIFTCASWLRWPLQMLALCGGYMGVAVVVALDPNCSYYAGASGALHGLLAGNAVSMAFAARSQRQFADAHCNSFRVSSSRWTLGLSIAVLGLMALKLWLEAGSLPAAPLGGWRFPVYRPAHIAGALGGMGLVLLVLTFRAVTAAKVNAECRQ
ncbi:MAG: rhomboid family intramembrane serine protease [Polaromonas sp.]|nr:rhomboid family intramembrane serine protease [Polaromonas sp.]